MYCCVPYCKSNKKVDKTISFHEFPSDMSLRDAWLKNISRKDFVPNDKSSSSVVCSKHFKASDYVPNFKIKRLQKGTVPTVFEDYPSYKQVSENKARMPVKRKCVEADVGAQSKRKIKELDTSEVRLETADALLQLMGDDCQQFEDFTSTTVNSNAKSVQTEAFYTSSVLNKRLRNLNKLLSYKNSCILKLQKKVDDLTEQVNYYKNDEYFTTVEKMCVRQGEGLTSIHEEFILAQIKNVNNKSPRWNESVIRECVFLNSVSPKGYRFLRNRNILQLPSKATLHRYIGPVSGEVGVSDLIKTRLKEEARNKRPEEIFASLVIDEMAIKPQCIYDKKLDSFFGPKTELDESRVRATPANRLLCFLLCGLSSTYSIPCAYYFTKQLTGQELYQLTCTVLKAVEDCGFFVVRIVTDNLSVNVAMFKKFGQGKLMEAIPHPLDAERKLFFSFDQNHIVKNIRSLFLERDMHDGQGVISGRYLKRLYRFQSKENIKPVRNLTFKHIYPSNLDKMNVRRAVAIFAPPVVAALQFLSNHSEQQALFKDASSTIIFLKNIYEWFSIHDVCNRTQHVYARNAAKMHFFSCDDKRLQWLEDFLGYLKQIEAACLAHQPPLKFLSKETNEAIILTTKSTISCIKYLLSNGYHYVLTRSFNSDAVESFFSSLRQMCGGNDMMDVRATVFAMEKLLKVGFVDSSDFSSVGKKQDIMGRRILKGVKPVVKDFNLPDNVVNILHVLLKEPDTPRTTLKTGALAYVAGYVVKILEDSIDCHTCIEGVAAVKCSAPLVSLIVHQDRGGLKYPQPALISVLGTIQEFVEQAVKLLPFQNVSRNLKKYILPNLLKSPLIKCKQSNHLTIAYETICDVFLPLLLKNIASNVPTRNAVLNKPLNRKVLKLS